MADKEKSKEAPAPFSLAFSSPKNSNQDYNSSSGTNSKPNSAPWRKAFNLPSIKKPGDDDDDSPSLVIKEEVPNEKSKLKKPKRMFDKIRLVLEKSKSEVIDIDSSNQGKSFNRNVLFSPKRLLSFRLQSQILLKS